MSPAAGLPSVKQCVGCHVVGSAVTDPAQAQLAFPQAERDSFYHAEASKLVEYWRRQEAIPWVQGAQPAGARPLLPRAARARRAAVPDLPRAGGGDGEGVPVLLAADGLVRGLPSRRDPDLGGGGGHGRGALHLRAAHRRPGCSGKRRAAGSAPRIRTSAPPPIASCVTTDGFRHSASGDRGNRSSPNAECLTPECRSLKAS